MRHLMRSRGASEEETVLVGDSRIDLETARAAGTDICLVRFGLHDNFPAAHLRGDEALVADPRDVPATLQALFASRARSGSSLEMRLPHKGR
jgi:phosphoglycolate phosphatase-like HAD superfamily hydrolase